jgi:hypothetical protein
MERLTVSQIAERLAIQPATWRAYVTRNAAPSPDGHYDRRTPWWWSKTIDRYEREHPKSRAA